MIKKITALASLLVYLYIPAQVYHVSAPVALHALNQADDRIWIFINIDIYNLPAFYTRNYKDVFKYLNKISTAQSHRVKAVLNTAMYYINPLYGIAYGSAPHIIGITRRSLSWSHLIQAACYEQNIIQSPERYQIALSSDTPEIPETNRYIELNTNVLYIDDNQCATCIMQYINDAQIPCQGIIYVDADELEVQSCIAQLQQRMPHIQAIGFCVQNEALQQKSAELQDFNSCLEQLYVQVAQDKVEKKLKTIDDEINKYKARSDCLEQMCRNR